MQKNKLDKLASERSFPCVTISMNTHRTFQNNTIELEKLIKEAHCHVVDEFCQYEINNLLEKMDLVAMNIDNSINMESLHIFLSNSTTEIIQSSWPISKNSVSVAENFVVKPLIKDLNRFEEYLILVLSQSDVRLLQATNDNIIGEIKNEDFRFSKNPSLLTDQDKPNDGKQADNLVREFFNQIDKSLVKIHNKTDMNIVVVSTDKNWSLLLQVADKPSIYYGNTAINYNDTEDHSLATDAWQIVIALQKVNRTNAIKEMQDAAGHGKMLTDIHEIFNAVKAGRGDLLITHDDYHQPVKMNGHDSFHLVDDVTQPGVIDDISSDIAWEVIAKKGRAIFTSQDEFKSMGNIALKVRY